MRGVGVQLANIIGDHASTPNHAETSTSFYREESESHDGPPPHSVSDTVAIDCDVVEDPKDVLRANLVQLAFQSYPVDAETLAERVLLRGMYRVLQLLENPPSMKQVLAHEH